MAAIVSLRATHFLSLRPCIHSAPLLTWAHLWEGMGGGSLAAWASAVPLGSLQSDIVAGGGWMFQVTGIQPDGTIGLDPWGGQQEARGRTSGAEFYIENILEELDSPREWFSDGKTLYYYPNSTAPPPSAVTVPRLATLISLEGVQTDSLSAGAVKDVLLQGFTLTHSLTTFMGEYEVPSGGDWSMHRGGAVFAQGVSGLTVDGCHFHRLGGNGLMLSEYAFQTKILRSEFSWIGDSAVSQMGSVKFDRTHNMDPNSNDLADLTDGRHPFGTSVQSCVFREIGVYGKQVRQTVIDR